MKEVRKIEKLEKRKKEIFLLVIIIIVAIGIIYSFFSEKTENIEEISSVQEEENNVVSTNNIIEEKIQTIMVHIMGQVNNPGVVELQENARIQDAIEAAGGTTNEADFSKINLAYILEDGMKIYIPKIGEEQQTYITKESGIIKEENEDEEEEELMININTASKEELESLPGIGESIATRIVNYRKENGKFSKIEDIQNVSGIGEAKYNNIKNYITVK